MDMWFEGTTYLACGEKSYGNWVKGWCMLLELEGRVPVGSVEWRGVGGDMKRFMVLEVEGREPVGRVEWWGWLEVIWRGVWCWRLRAGYQLEELNGGGGWR